MRAGKLDRRITICRNYPTRSDAGSPVDNWTEFATVSSRIKYERGAERFANDQIVGKTPVTFTIRWSSNVSSVTVLDLVQYNGRLFDIQDVRELGRNEGIEIDGLARSEESLGLVELELREDGGIELREDGSLELRE